MKKTILILSALFLVFACDKEQAPAPSKTELLTGGNEKSWYIYSSTPEDRCASAADDSWTFSADGGFAYDHGTVLKTKKESVVILSTLKVPGRFRPKNPRSPSLPFVPLDPLRTWTL